MATESSELPLLYRRPLGKPGSVASEQLLEEVSDCMKDVP